MVPDPLLALVARSAVAVLRFVADSCVTAEAVLKAP